MPKSDGLPISGLGGTCCGPFMPVRLPANVTSVEHWSISVNTFGKKHKGKTYAQTYAHQDCRVGHANPPMLDFIAYCNARRAQDRQANVHV